MIPDSHRAGGRQVKKGSLVKGTQPGPRPDLQPLRRLRPSALLVSQLATASGQSAALLSPLPDLSLIRPTTIASINPLQFSDCSTGLVSRAFFTVLNALTIEILIYSLLSPSFDYFSANCDRVVLALFLLCYYSHIFCSLHSPGGFNSFAPRFPAAAKRHGKRRSTPANQTD